MTTLLILNDRERDYMRRLRKAQRKGTIYYRGAVILVATAIAKTKAKTTERRAQLDRRAMIARDFRNAMFAF